MRRACGLILIAMLAFALAYASGALNAILSPVYGVELFKIAEAFRLYLGSFKGVIQIVAEKPVVVLAALMVVHYMWVAAPEIKHVLRRRISNLSKSDRKWKRFCFITVDAGIRAIVPVMFYTFVYGLDIGHHALPLAV